MQCQGIWSSSLHQNAKQSDISMYVVRLSPLPLVIFSHSPQILFRRNGSRIRTKLKHILNMAYLSSHSPGSDYTSSLTLGVRHVGDIVTVHPLIKVFINKVAMAFVQEKVMNKTFISFLYDRLKLKKQKDKVSVSNETSSFFVRLDGFFSYLQ